MPTDRSSSNYAKYYNKGEFLQSVVSKKIIEIDLRTKYKTQYENLLNGKLLLISNELKKIKTLKDTNTVLKVKIDNSNTFGQIVWLINQTRVHLINNWLLADDAFYFKNVMPDKLAPEAEIQTFTL